MTFVTSAILIGLAGNLHCIGMCGPIAFLLPLGQQNWTTKILGIAVYNFGRILTYSMFGLLFGLFGQGLNLGAFQQYTTISFGVFILAWVLLPVISKKLTSTTSKLHRFQNFVKSKLGEQLKKRSLLSLFTLGLLNGLLPCGLIYLALAGAIATGNALNGAIFMVFFGIGTLPVMFIVPYFANSITTRYRQKAQKVMPYLLTVMALIFILRGMNLDIPYLSPKYSEDNTTIESCCHGPNTCTMNHSTNN